MMEKKSEQQWRQLLNPIQYHVLREEGTERPFSGEYNKHFPRDGVYECVGCGACLFKSTSKFKSECGWPAFDSPATHASLIEEEDGRHGMIRTKVKCAQCHGHLGHVFDDGPTETGRRYCINSTSLCFKDVHNLSTQPH